MLLVNHNMLCVAGTVYNLTMQSLFGDYRFSHTITQLHGGY